MNELVSALALVALAALTSLLVRRIGLPWFNPVTVAAAVWSPAVLIAGAPGELEPGLTATTITLLLVAWVLFAAGTVFGWWITTRGVARVRAVPIEVDRRLLTALHVVLTLMLIGFGVTEFLAVLPIIDRLGGLQGVLSGRSVAFRAEQAAARNEQLAHGITGGSLVLGAVGYLLFLGHAALLTGAALWGRRRRTLAVAPLVVLGVLSVVTFERTYFVMGLLLFIAALGCLRAPRSAPAARRGRVLRIALAAAAGVGVLGVLLIPLLLRNSGTVNSSGVQSLFQYYLSGIAGLNGTIGSLAPHQLLRQGAPAFGAYSFSGLVSVLQRLGVPFPHPVDSYQIVYIARGEFATNIGSSLVDLYRDTGGLAGLFIVIAVCGAAGGGVLARARAGAVWALPVSVWYLALLMWSFFGDSLTKDLRYLVLVVVAAGVLALGVTLRRRRATLTGVVPATVADSGGASHDAAALVPLTSTPPGGDR